MISFLYDKYIPVHEGMSQYFHSVGESAMKHHGPADFRSGLRQKFRCLVDRQIRKSVGIFQDVGMSR